MLSWTLLLAVAAAVLVVWFWFDSMKARERANSAAQDACERASLQFLDGTAAFSTLRLSRDHGRLAFRRTYVFDYTARSIERLQGFVVLRGSRVETVGFAPQTELRPPEPKIPPPPPVSTSRPANVLDLEEWRRQRRKTGSHDEFRRTESGDSRW